MRQDKYWNARFALQFGTPINNIAAHRRTHHGNQFITLFMNEMFFSLFGHYWLYIYSNIYIHIRFCWSDAFGHYSRRFNARYRGSSEVPFASSPKKFSWGGKFAEVVSMITNLHCVLRQKLTHWGLDKMDDIFKWIFLNVNGWISITNSWVFVSSGPINIPPSVTIMAWRRPGAKPLSELMAVSLLRHICVTQPQWVKWWIRTAYAELLSKRELKTKA